MTTQLTHPTYKFVDEKEADAFAWVFTHADKPMQKVAIQFPPLKPTEIRANVTYTGLCHSDLLTVRSKWGPAPYPIAPGHEICGIITHIGSDVKDFKVGEKVAFGTVRENCDQCKPCQSNLETICTYPFEQKYTYGKLHWGGYATAIQQPAKWFFKVPESLPAEKVPPLLCAGITVYKPIAEHCKPGQNVGIIGIGGLGHLAVMYAKAWGCKVTAFTSSNGKEDFIKKLGADKVVVSTPENLAKESSQYDVIINTLPINGDLSAWIDLCGIQGTFVQVGAGPAGELNSINLMSIIFKHITFTSSLTGSRKDTREMLEFSAKHNIVPLCEQFDFENFPEAFDKLENGKPIFRCVVDVTKAAPKH